MKPIRMLNGYRLIYRPDHPNAMSSENWAGYVYEHIAIAQEFLGRELRDNEVVHHLNGKRDDNRISNLLVLERSQHSRLHDWINNGAPYGGILRVNVLNSGKPKSDEPLFCIVCSKTIPTRDGSKYCSVECSGLGSRKVDRPSKEQLELDISNMSWLAIGRKYGVSDNAVRKWAKKYGLIG